MKKSVITLVAVLLLVTILAACGPAKPAEKAVRIYGSSAALPTGTGYIMAAPTLEYVNANSKQIRVTPAQSGGHVENLRRVSRGEFAFGDTNAYNMADAWQGVGSFKEPLRDARTVGPWMLPLTHVFVVRADSGIKTLAELAGKDYGAGAPGSVAEVLTKDVIKYAGLEGKVNLKSFPYTEMLDMVTNRSLVGHARTSVEPGNPYWKTADAQLKGIRMLDQKPVVATLTKDKPYISAKVFEKGADPWITEPITQIFINPWYIVNKDVPEEDVYEITRLIYSQGAVDHTDKAIPGIANLWPKNKDPLNGLTLPLHPGAEKFWKEQKVNIPTPVYK